LLISPSIVDAWCWESCAVDAAFRVYRCSADGWLALWMWCGVWAGMSRFACDWERDLRCFAEEREVGRWCLTCGAFVDRRAFVEAEIRGTFAVVLVIVLVVLGVATVEVVGMGSLKLFSRIEEEGNFRTRRRGCWAIVGVVGWVGIAIGDLYLCRVVRC
jgi:hypothetical protein